MMGPAAARQSNKQQKVNKCFINLYTIQLESVLMYTHNTTPLTSKLTNKRMTVSRHIMR